MLEEDRRYIRRMLIDDLQDKRRWAEANPKEDWPDTHRAYKESKERLDRFDAEFPNPVIQIAGVKRQA